MPVSQKAIIHVAGRRIQDSDPNLLRDSEKIFWPQNLKMPELIERGDRVNFAQRVRDCRAGALEACGWGLSSPAYPRV